MDAFFTSDMHFGHENIIKYCNRPFSCANEMNEKLIENWNSKVGKKDVIYHLGDFSFKTKAEKVLEIIDRLNGNIVFIKGNHDKLLMKALKRSLPDIVEVKIQDDEIGKHLIVLCHYPMISWNNSHRGTWQLFGHHHTINEKTSPINDKLSLNQLDVGIDAHNYFPISYEEVKKIITIKNLFNGDIL